MFRDADQLARSPARATALACLEAGIQAAHPQRVIQGSVCLDGDTLIVDDARYELSGVDRILVLGGGKGAGPVAAALESKLGDRLAGGAVVCPDPVDTERVEVLIGDHPVPSGRSVAGTRRVLDLAASADASTLVLAVITGGGSALLAAPVEGIELADVQQVTDDLLASGASIHEMNAVRKHLSAIKGGGLARAAAPARTVGLVFSDVVGNDLDVIASGPTAPDPSTYAEARAVLDRYGIEPPTAIADRLDRGARGDLPETASADDPTFDDVTNHVLADGFTALAAARDVARDRGYTPCILSSRVRGEAREAAPTMVAVAEESRATGNPVSPPAVMLTGGECTVTVTGDGRGGPNQEFALAGALELTLPGVALACVDTDGRDGATDAAGAIVDETTVRDGTAAQTALDGNDAYPYLDDAGALLRTGPTGTNVNDLRVIVVESVGP